MGEGMIFWVARNEEGDLWGFLGEPYIVDGGLEPLDLGLAFNENGLPEHIKAKKFGDNPVPVEYIPSHVFDERFSGLRVQLSQTQAALEEARELLGQTSFTHESGCSVHAGSECDCLQSRIKRLLSSSPAPAKDRAKERAVIEAAEAWVDCMVCDGGEREKRRRLSDAVDAYHDDALAARRAESCPASEPREVVSAIDKFEDGPGGDAPCSASSSSPLTPGTSRETWLTSASA